METVPRNVILDLLPAYIAGEAREESRALVEEFARNDPQIARLIRTGKLEPAVISLKMAMPDDLEMKTMKRVRRSITMGCKGTNYLHLRTYLRTLSIN